MTSRKKTGNLLKIRRSRMRPVRGKQQMLSFETYCFANRESETPKAELRRVIAWNINKIEKRIKTQFSRSKKTSILFPNKSGSIVLPFGQGSYGAVFRLLDGRVIKITTDETEAAAAIFWKISQNKNPKLLNGTAAVYDVFKMYNKQKKEYYGIVREEVDIPIMCPRILENTLDRYICHFLDYCAIKNRKSTLALIELNRSRIALSSVKLVSKGLGNALEYSWNQGIPMIDASSQNLGRRLKRNKKISSAETGVWVLFDFGGLDPQCFNSLKINSTGSPLKLRNRVQFYYEKIPKL